MVATKFLCLINFKKNFNAYILLDKTLETDFNDFLIKKIGGVVLSKDSPFVGPLVGIWHYHIRFGNLIITYAMDNSHIEIYTIDDHSAYDGDKAKKQLREYIKGLTEDSFIDYLIPDKKLSFTTEQLAIIYDLIWSLCGDQSLMIFVQTGSGLFKDLLYAELSISNEQEFKEFLRLWEKQYNVRFDKFISRTLHANNNQWELKMRRLFTKEEIAAKIASAKIYMDARPELRGAWAAAVAELNSRTYICESGAYTTPVKKGDLIPIVDIGDQLEFDFMEQ